MSDATQQDLAQATSVHNFILFYREEAGAGRKVKATVFRWMVNETWFSPRLYPTHVRAMHPRSHAVQAGEPFQFEHVVTMKVCTDRLLTSRSVAETLDILQRCSVFALVTSAEHKRLDRGIPGDIDDPWARYRRAGVELVWPGPGQASPVRGRDRMTPPLQPEQVRNPSQAGLVGEVEEVRNPMDQVQSYANGFRHAREAAGLGRVKAAALLSITTTRLWNLEYSTAAGDPDVVAAIDRFNALT